ncbi:molybdopterin-dependent oxidoreductase, partial [Candidatus Gracilibacteria bacterium]|nr:molybdopterin-dependent oxidoreductase [Candidatus Gracilibacteria bacterium]
RARAQVCAPQIDIAKLYDDAMLAYAINGSALGAKCGGPVRLVLPGRDGRCWVPQVAQISLTSQLCARTPQIENRKPAIADTEQDGHTAADRSAEPTDLTVTALICGPQPGAMLLPGQHEISGFAWSAGRGIATVEVDLGGDRGWVSAELGEDDGPRAWRTFKLAWEAVPGEHWLTARAIDRLGNRSKPGERAKVTVTATSAATTLFSCAAAAHCVRGSRGALRWGAEGQKGA